MKRKEKGEMGEGGGEQEEEEGISLVVPVPQCPWLSLATPIIQVIPSQAQLSCSGKASSETPHSPQRPSP